MSESPTLGALASPGCGWMWAPPLAHPPFVTTWSLAAGQLHEVEYLKSQSLGAATLSERTTVEAATS